MSRGNKHNRYRREFGARRGAVLNVNELQRQTEVYTKAHG